MFALGRIENDEEDIQYSILPWNNQGVEACIPPHIRAMEEGIVDVELMNRPRTSSSNGKK